MIGKVYAIQPQPPVEENMRYFDAGALRLGVEYRALDPESLVETYKDRPDELAEMLEKSPEGGFADEGVTVHVFDATDGHEYLRFDMFDDEPHYHYVHKTTDGSIVNNVIDFDVPSHGDMLPWVLRSLRTRLPNMLEEAGAHVLAGKVDPATVDRALVDVEACCIQARGGRA
jgi:hypothetical protein